jgi:microcin C transport system substrate-binding protein
MIRLFSRCSLLLLLLGSGLQAAPQHAITLYDEPPKYPADFQHFDYVNPQAPKGGVLRQAGFGSFDSLNPFINKGVPADDIGLIYETLTRHSLDEPFTEYGLIASQIERAPDNSWVRFYLRPEARFNDGKQVTADDVVFTFETLMRDGAPQYKSYYADVSKATAESPTRVRFDFKHKGNRELPLILGQLPVLPRHRWVADPTGSPTCRPDAASASSGSLTGGARICRSIAVSTTSTSW